MHPGKGPNVFFALIGWERPPISINLKTNIGPWIRAVQDIKGSRVIHKNFGKFGEKVKLWPTIYESLSLKWMTHTWLIFFRMKSTWSYLESKNVFSLVVLEKITAKKLSKMKSAENAQSLVSLEKSWFWSNSIAPGQKDQRLRDQKLNYSDDRKSL